MKVVIPGGSGQVGIVLARELQADGHEVIVLSRSPERRRWRVARWDATTLGAWTTEFEGADAVINLAGRSVNCRYNTENREAITQSRVESTRIVGEAISQAKASPRVWLQASTATIYAHRFDAPNDEATGIIGGQEHDSPETWRFSIDVAKSWERTLDEAQTPRTRKVKLRSAMIMSPDRGGIFDTLLGLVRHALGGKAGSGRQYISWIHYKDFISAIRWLIAHDELDGAVNLASPHPLPNAEFMRALREAWGIRIGLPAMEWMLGLGAILLRTETELVLKSRRVVPGRLLETGFNFQFPDWPEAAHDLCRRWRELAAS
jgi:uncharacterized protein (TIGR01777 family)